MLGLATVSGCTGTVELITVEGVVIEVFDVIEGVKKDLSFLGDGVYYLRNTQSQVVKLVKN